MSGRWRVVLVGVCVVVAGCTPDVGPDVAATRASTGPVSPPDGAATPPAPTTGAPDARPSSMPSSEWTAVVDAGMVVDAGVDGVVHMWLDEPAPDQPFLRRLVRG